MSAAFSSSSFWTACSSSSFSSSSSSSASSSCSSSSSADLVCQLSSLIVNRLTDTERSLFSLVKEYLLSDSSLSQTEVRVAGGWVRDKLLNVSCTDLDFALNNISGTAFAQGFHSFLQVRGITTSSSVGVIKMNPDQSKHLETATFRFEEISIDVNRFRDETYSSDNRIPITIPSNAKADAERRDFTLNSLFYNIHTQLIEDETGYGLIDFKNGFLRTPRDPLITFTDDPLRLLRAARFAARFGYKLDEKIHHAASDKKIHENLQAKVSRERFGQEIHKILKLPQSANLAFRLLNQWGVRNIVCELTNEQDEKQQMIENTNEKVWKQIKNLRENSLQKQLDEITINTMDAAQKLCDELNHSLAEVDSAAIANVSSFSSSSSSSSSLSSSSLPWNCLSWGLSSEDRSSILLSSYLSVYGGYSYEFKKGRAITVVFHIITSSMKLPHEDANICQCIIAGAAKLLQLTELFSAASNNSARVQQIQLKAGHILKSLLLAVKSDPAKDYSRHAFLVCAAVLNAQNASLQPLTDLYNWLRSVHLFNVCHYQPFIRGKELQALCSEWNISGVMIAEFQTHQFNWFLLNPNGNEQQFRDFLKNARVSKADALAAHDDENKAVVMQQENNHSATGNGWSVQQFESWLQNCSNTSHEKDSGQSSKNAKRHKK